MTEFAVTNQMNASERREERSDNENRLLDKQQVVKLTTDYLGEDRHEFVARLAYKLWEERGHPFDSPEVDWFAAERAVYASLAASGLIAPSPNDSQHMAAKIYR